MKFSVRERLRLFELLPAQGNMTNLKIVRKLREALTFSEAEHRRYGITTVGGSVSWTSDGDKEILLGPRATEIVTQTLKALNDDGRLPIDCMSLYEKFFPERAHEDEEVVSVSELEITTGLVDMDRVAVLTDGRAN